MRQILSTKQLRILKLLRISPCSTPALARYYSYSNVYVSLNNLQRRGLIRNKGNLWYITGKGEIVSQLR